MYRRATLFGLTSLLLVGVILVALFCVPTKKDLEAFRSLLSQRHLASSSKSFSSTYQKRTGVRKDIFFVQDDASRLQYRLESDSSILTLSPGEDQIEVVEKLEKIRCSMQDRLYMGGDGSGPMQQVRYLLADEGVYKYHTQQFIAQSVDLSFSRLGGHTLPLAYDGSGAFLKGIAQDVTFSITGKTPQFQARDFKATLKQEK
jgi:hypothetical protein